MKTWVENLPGKSKNQLWELAKIQVLLFVVVSYMGKKQWIAWFAPIMDNLVIVRIALMLRIIIARHMDIPGPYAVANSFIRLF